MSKKKTPAVRVDWIDSMGSSGWHEHRKSDLRCTSVGMLYDETDESVVIALNRSAYNHGDYIEIPKIAIKKITKLKKVKR